MNDSFARIKTEEAKRLANETIRVVAEVKAKNLAGYVQRELDRHNWWTFLPWVKSWDAEQAKLSLIRRGDYWTCFGWSQFNRSKAVLNLVQAAGSDPFIYITAEDYDYIRFGVNYAACQE
jgi:hypothetical protein